MVNYFDKQVIIISNQFMVAYYLHKNQLIHQRSFKTTHISEDEFSSHLQHIPNVPTYLLVDVIEEDYKQTGIPHVTGLDKNRLISRKLTKIHRDTPFMYGEIQGKDKTNAHHDVLFSAAIINPELILPWLKLLLKHLFPIVGIYSLPLLSRYLLKHLSITGENILLISHQQYSGLRQSFFVKNQLKISRLTPIYELENDLYSSILMKEADKTLKYLNRLRLINQGDIVNVVVLTDPAQLEVADLLSHSTDSIKYHIQEIQLLLKKIHCTISNPLYSDELFIALLARRNIKNHYAPAKYRKYYFHKLAEYTLTACAGLSAGLLLFFGGVNFIDGQKLSHEIQQIQSNTQTTRDHYHTALLTLPKTELDAHQTKTVVTTVETVKQYHHDTFAGLIRTSELLMRFPQLRINHLEWFVTENKLAGLALKPGDDSNAQTTDTTLPATEPLHPYEILVLEGEIYPFSGAYRFALDKLNAFVDTLKAENSGLEVNVLELPLNTESRGKIISDSQITHDFKASFKLRVVFP